MFLSLCMFCSLERKCLVRMSSCSVSILHLIAAPLYFSSSMSSSSFCNIVILSVPNSVVSSRVSISFVLSLFLLFSLMANSWLTLMIKCLVLTHISTAHSGHLSISSLHIVSNIVMASLSFSLPSCVLFSFQYAAFLLFPSS